MGRISENKKKKMEIDQAVREAVEWACEQDLLDGFVREQKEGLASKTCLTALSANKRRT